MRADMPGVLMAARWSTEVVPGPAVEAVLLHVGHIIGNEVVAEAIALVGGAPELAGDGVDGFADAVANAGGVNLDEFALGREFENIRAMELLWMGIWVIHVGVRAYRDKHLGAVLGEGDVAGPVA